MNWRRIGRLLKKELIQTTRDWRMLFVIFFSSVVQLLMFGYVVSTDVHNVATAVYDQDRSAASRQFVERLMSSGYFTYEYDVTRPAEVDRLLDATRVQVVIAIPRGFAQAMTRGTGAEVQAIMDGTDAMTARIITGYVADVVQGYGTRIALARLERLRGARLPSLDVRTRVWYNPELRSMYFMVPAVLGEVLMIITIMLTALAIVKEKENGTLEQLIVTPISSLELMVGKTLPFLLVGLIDVTLILLVAVFWFGVPIAGSVPLLYGLIVLFLLNSLGLGLLVSTLSHTQHEAMLTTIFFLLPAFILSGFMFPIDNMPPFMQGVAYLIPMRYFLEILRGIFLKGEGLATLWPQALILAAFGVLTIAIAAARFRKRVG
jgi:ABC-2 type transport system permease protein